MPVLKPVFQLTNFSPQIYSLYTLDGLCNSDLGIKILQEKKIRFACTIGQEEKESYMSKQSAYAQQYFIVRNFGGKKFW